MRHAAALIVLGALLAAVDNVPAASKSHTPVTSSIKKLKMSPEELRIRVRALIRPTLGTIEESADRIIAEATDPKGRRNALLAKIEMTSTLLAAMLRTDPVLALADAWGYVIQVEALESRPSIQASFGASLPVATGAVTAIEKQFRDFAGSLQDDLPGEVFEATVRTWANEHPIEGALYKRPSMDSAVAASLAAASKGGTFAALGGLQETTADVMKRMDLYTMYVPRLARWEAELAVDDLAGGVDPKDVLAQLERFSRAADRLASVAEATPGMVARERDATLAAVHAERLAATNDLRAERAAVLDAVREERIATLREIEAIAQRLVDRSAAPLHAAVREDFSELVDNVEEMRGRLISEAADALYTVVDHAFVRAIELLLIGAALSFAGMVVHARWLRR
jgi:hypothetical protein